MANELDVSKLDGWTLIGPPGEIEVSKLDGWTLIGPSTPPPSSVARSIGRTAIVAAESIFPGLRV